MITYKNFEDSIINNNSYVVLHGQAGSGKSYFINKFSSKFCKRCLTIAPTGITSRQISGITIDSLINQFNSKPEQTLCYLGSNFDFIVLDEVSMCQMFKIDILFEIIGELRSRGKFIKLIIIGDPFQLQPVTPKNMINEYSKKYQRQLIWDDFYFFKSNSFLAALQNRLINFYYFGQNYRQNDGNFVFFLKSIAQGIVDDNSLLYLNQRYNPELVYYPVVTTKKEMAKFINRDALSKLSPSIPPFVHCPEKKIILPAFADVEEENRELLDPLEYKHGALVRFIKNEHESGIVNGTTGTITNIDPATTTIEVTTTQEQIFTCQPIDFKIYRLVYIKSKNRVENEVVAIVKRLPFMLSYGITVHRCQGLTLESMVFNSFDGCFAAGQLYVALSRVKSLMNLALQVRIDKKDVIVSKSVIDYHNYFQQHCQEVEKEHPIQSSELMASTP